MNSVWYSPPEFSSVYKTVLPLTCGGWHVALHGCKPSVAILCWSQINTLLLGNCQSIYFQSTDNIYVGPIMLLFRYFLLWALFWSFGYLVQFSHSIMSNSLQPHEPQHTRPPCPSPNPRVYPNSCPLSRWCHLTISSSVIPFSSCLQSFPTSGSFQMGQFFPWGGQNIGISASTSVLPMNTQDWFPLEWTGWISLQSKGLSRVLSNTTVQKHQFFGTQLSLESNSHIHTWPLAKPQPWLDGPLLAKWCLCFLICCLCWS